jgi:nucleoside-diphosphate-sugar epimerase
MKVLITGHMGLLGRHLGRILKKRGHEIHGCDIRLGKDCREIFENNTIKYDAVFHCAHDHLPAKQMSLDASLLRWSARSGVKKLVYFSSTDVYPLELQQAPHRLVEDEAYPDNPMGQVRLASEYLVQEQGGWVFRPFAVYGDGGEGPFAKTLRALVSGGNPVALDGCGEVHDYLHALDAASAVLSFVLNDINPGPVNICSGEPLAVDELALQIMAAMGQKRDLLCNPGHGEFFRCGDNTAMSKIWPPKIGLQTGIRHELGLTSISLPTTPKKVSE